MTRIESRIFTEVGQRIREVIKGFDLQPGVSPPRDSKSLMVAGLPS
jgi:hypothetical protein